MKIRQAELGDLDEIEKLYNRIIETMDPLYRPDWQKGIYPDRALLEELIGNGDVLTAEENSHIIGAIVVNERFNPSYEKGNWEKLPPSDFSVIHLLAADPSRQHQGVARNLLEYVIERERNRGKKALRLDVYSRNVGAARFYLRNGFRHAGSVRQKYEEQTHSKMSNLFEYLLEQE